MMALHLHNYPIKQSNVPESAEKSRGHKTVNVSKTSADMLKKTAKTKLTPICKKYEITSVQVTMTQHG